MELVKQLEARVEECKRSVERAKQELATFQAALDFERRKQSPSKRGRKIGRKAGKVDSLQAEAETSTSPALPFITRGEGGENKTDLLRKYIGTVPGLPKAEVMAYGNKRIMGANKNFGYTTVAKMLERQEIEIREGRVYPTNKLLQKLEAAEKAAS
jgi:hypothetical protein